MTVIGVGPPGSLESCTSHAAAREPVRFHLRPV